MGARQRKCDSFPWLSARCLLFSSRERRKPRSPVQAVRVRMHRTVLRKEQTP